MPTTVNVLDTFNRSLSNEWGTSDSGHTWSLFSGDPENFDVVSQRGIAAQPSAPGGGRQALDAWARDWDLTTEFVVPHTPSGSGRYITRCNLYHSDGNEQVCEVQFDPDSTIYLRLFRRVDNAIIDDETQSTVTTYDNNRWYRLRLQMQNNGHLIRVKIWDREDPEPPGWDISQTPTGRRIFLNTQIHLGAFRQNGNTVSFETYFEEIEATGTIPDLIEEQVQDDFNRNEVDGWGDPDSGSHGEPWTPFFLSTANNHSTNGALALLETNGNDSTRIGSFIQYPFGEDFDVRCWISYDDTISGDDEVIAIVSGRTQSNETLGYAVQVRFTSDEVAAQLYERHSSGDGALTNFETLEGVSSTTSTAILVRLLIKGDRIRAKVWENGTVEPGSWLFDETDNTVSGLGTVALQAEKTGAVNTVEFDTFSFDTMVRIDDDTASFAESEELAIAVSDSEVLSINESESLDAPDQLFDTDAIGVSEAEDIDYQVANWHDSETISIEEAEVAVQWFEDGDNLGALDAMILSLEDQDQALFSEDHVGFIDEISVVFNNSLNAPGFVVTLRGLLEGTVAFDRLDVFRRDPSGRYRDQRVRGLADVFIEQNDLIITDYEAPLNTRLEYYVRLYQGEAEFRVGPIRPEPQPFIPTMSEAYAGGTAYLKPIDIPELSRPVMIDKGGLNTWSRPANILAQHHVLGRPNKVVITDVRGGREGSLRGHCIRTKGQSWEVIEEILSPGVTVLIQNHNPTISTYPDMYVQVEDVTFTRPTTMVRHGELDNNGEEVVATFEFSYVQVDRPDPTGVQILEATWQVVFDTFNSWERVHDLRTSWLDLLLRPVGPDGESS